MKNLPSICFAWILFTSSTCFGGVVANGSFESGLDFWSPSGLTGIQTSTFGVNPDSGINQALLRTGDGAPASTLVADLANFLSVPVSAINSAAPNAFNGSAIKQTITGVEVGQKLSFAWNYLTSETINTPQDFAFWSVSPAVGTPGTPNATLLGSTSAASQNFDGGVFFKQSGYSTHTFTFNTAGDYTIGFGVVNAIDAAGPSALLIDSVSLSAVPEPTSLAGLSLLGVALAFRRRRR